MPSEKPSVFSPMTIGIALFVIALLGFGGYTVMTLMTQQSVQNDVDTQAKGVQIKNNDWDKTLLQSPVVQSLKSHSSGAFEVGKMGNPSPFTRPE